MEIISGSGFKKDDLKDKVYMMIIREIQFNGIVADNPFDLVFTCMTIL